MQRIRMRGATSRSLLPLRRHACHRPLATRTTTTTTRATYGACCLALSLALSFVDGAQAWSFVGPPAATLKASSSSSSSSTLPLPPVCRGGSGSLIPRTVCRASTTSTAEEASQLEQAAAAASLAPSPSPLDNREDDDDENPKAPRAAQVEILADADAFVQPENDRRRYRTIRLANNLKVLLVSDQMSQGVGVEAASVHIQAGHFDDSLQGLAHFHEHMLFLGTKKYPLEDEYEDFLSRAGGFSNAYTDMEDTNYFFTITTEAHPQNQTTLALQGALDRLAQFFVAPLFSPQAVERELRAIDSEHVNSKTSDAWRGFQLLKSTVDPAHPFAKFGCGNYETLLARGQETLLAELHRFWQVYYQTYNMRLAVTGHASLDALQQTVQDTFGALAPSEGNARHDKQLPGQVFGREHAVYGVQAYSPDQLGKLRRVIPHAESRSCKVYFAVPPVEDPLTRDLKLERAISHVLGHESPGSLHALLNEEGYLLDLSAGMAITCADFSLFAISLSLTPKGIANVQKVLDLVFAWIALLKDNQDQLSYYHDELRSLSAMNFRFREVSDPTDFSSNAAEALFDDHVPPERLLVDSSLSSDFDPVVAEAYLDRFHPDNCMVTLVNSDFDRNEGTWQVEPWYGATYQVEDLDVTQKEAWSNPTNRDPRLQLPALNAYIPTDFSLRCDDDDKDPKETVTKAEIDRPPSLLLETPSLRMWHKMDKYWRVPKTSVYLSLSSPEVYRSPRSMTMNRLFQRVLNDDLNSFVYDASVAGCNYKVTCVPDGYRISVGGYSEKIPFLLDTLTARIQSLVQEMKSGDAALREKFTKALDSLLRETKNYRLDAPNEIANYNARVFMEENVWYLDNYVSEMQGPQAERHPLTMEECGRVAEETLMGRIQAEALAIGNISVEGAKQVAEVIERRFLASTRLLSEVEVPRFRSLKLPTVQEATNVFGTEATRSIPLVYQEYAYSETEENNAVELTLQAGSELDLGYEGIAILDLICNMAYNSAFNQLRTKEQLGYLVSASARRTAGGAWGMSVVVQGSVATPDVLEERCEAWLETFYQELQDMTPEEIAQEASAVMAQYMEKETKLSQEVGRVWSEIVNTEGLSDRMRTPVFDRMEKLAKQLELVEEKDQEQNDNGLRTAVQLQERILAFFAEHFLASSPTRRIMSSRVYSHNSKQAYEATAHQPGVLTTYADMRFVKQFLSTWPSVPYWRNVQKV